MRILTLAMLILLSTSTLNAESDCNLLDAKMKELSMLLPIRYANGTEFRRQDLICEHKIITEHLYLSHANEQADLKDLPFEQDQWVELQCGTKGMSSHGWTYTKRYYDKTGEFIYSIESTPAMCSLR